MNTIIVLTQLVLGWALIAFGVYHLAVNYSFWTVALPIFLSYLVTLYMTEVIIDEWWGS